MNTDFLQFALMLPCIPYHLRNRRLSELKLNQVVEVSLAFQRQHDDYLAVGFMEYARGMKLNFGDDWQTRPMGFTLGANHSTTARRFWYEQNQLYSGRGW